MSIILDQINKTFISGFRKKKTPAVIDLSLEVNSGEIFGIVGPNGAGKSTILKMLMDFIRPDSGKITLFGSRPTDPKIRYRTGYLPENPYFYDHLSAEELMRFGARASGMSSEDTRRNIQRLLKLMNLEEAGQRKLRNYSKGMTQRAGICFALIHNPELIILDEPMSGLDPIGRKLLVDLILRLKAKNKTLLFCSHILNDVERLCDRMAIMNKGRLKSVLTKQDMLEQQNLITLSVKSVPANLSQKLTAAGIKTESRGEFQNILVPREKINEIMSALSEHGIKVLSLDTTSNSLEKIFLATVNN